MQHARRLMLVGLVILGLSAGPALAANLPLPDDVKVVKSDGLSPDQEAWLGQWGPGEWVGPFDPLPGLLIVEEINPDDGQTTGVYSWGQSNDLRPGYVRFSGTLEGDTLAMSFSNGANVTFKMDKPGELVSGTYVYRGYTSKIKFSKAAD